jgi:glyoxalase family protein
MTVESKARTLDLMTGLLGYRVENEQGNRIRLAVNGDAPGRIVDVVVDPAAGPGMNGLGTVHHVAMAVETADDQLRFQKELIRYGCEVTDVRDRCYFTSIYFREPGGVLFEIATVPPGFTIDEKPDELGSALKLPWWEEPYRKEIEAKLASVRT